MKWTSGFTSVSRVNSSECVFNRFGKTTAATMSSFSGCLAKDSAPRLGSLTFQWLTILCWGKKLVSLNRKQLQIFNQSYLQQGIGLFSQGKSPQLSLRHKLSPTCWLICEEGDYITGEKYVSWCGSELQLHLGVTIRRWEGASLLWRSEVCQY